MTGNMTIGPGGKLALNSSSSSFVVALIGIFSSSFSGVGVSSIWFDSMGVSIIYSAVSSAGFSITLYLT
jgi:hypothetical protein